MRPELTAEQRVVIDALVDQKIDQLFDEALATVGAQSGDLPPGVAHELDEALNVLKAAVRYSCRVNGTR